jgi:hypothetical protein
LFLNAGATYKQARFEKRKEEKREGEKQQKLKNCLNSKGRFVSFKAETKEMNEEENQICNIDVLFATSFHLRWVSW